MGRALEWFFQSGGGLIALGLSSSDYLIGTASETVFPLFGTSYQTGKMDPGIGKIRITCIKEQDDEISDGLGDFTVTDHKFLLSLNKTTNSYQPRFPESGEYKILYREKETGAPSLVKYRNVGVSVTFASFGGDDFEKGFAYYGSYADMQEFRTLFTRSVNWAGTTEEKNDAHMELAASYHENLRKDLALVREEAKDFETRAKTNHNLRIVLTTTIAAVACILTYWFTFRFNIK